jgi:glycosyltransferase involved in cell wall biosynthesis
MASCKKKCRPRRLAILINQVAPYRVPLLARIGERFESHVFVGMLEPNRDWGSVPKRLVAVEVRQSWGGRFAMRTPGEEGTFDLKWVHINPGYLVDLIRTRPDAVISAEIGFRTLCALAYGSLFRKPVWIWWGGTPHTERKQGLVRRILRHVVARWASHWITYGNEATAYLNSIGVQASGIVQIQNCVDETIYARPVEPAVALNPHPVLLHVGQLLQRKGLSQLFHAAARLQAQGFNFSLLLVGGGPEKGALEALANRLGLRNLHFMQPRPSEQMPGIYRCADCLVFSTLEDVWGLVVNEAMWSGLPVISSIYAGCTSELVPVENRFDPLSNDSFDAVLLRAIQGRVGRPDTARLRTASQVADKIIMAIEHELSANGTATRF